MRESTTKNSNISVMLLTIQLCAVYFVSLLVIGYGTGVKNVRIVEGVHKLSNTAAIESYPDAAIPDVLSGPESLYFLNGLCFTKSFDRNEYTVCPFQNITQRRSTGQFGTQLGIWGSWLHDASVSSLGLVGPDEYKLMKYVDGKSCGESKVDTKLILECDHDGDFEIISVNDSVFCAYVLKLGLPIACSLLKK